MGSADYVNMEVEDFFVIIKEQDIIWLAINFIRMIYMMKNQQN